MGLWQRYRGRSRQLRRLGAGGGDGVGDADAVRVVGPEALGAVGVYGRVPGEELGERDEVVCCYGRAVVDVGYAVAVDGLVYFSFLHGVCKGHTYLEQHAT